MNVSVFLNFTNRNYHLINHLHEDIFTEELHKFEVMNVKKELYLASASPRRRDLLTGLGADIKIIKTDTEEKIDVNQTDKHGFTALHTASFLGLDFDDLSLLVGAGANINQKNDWGDTALFSASDLKTVENLLHLGVNPSLENRWGEKASDYFKRRAFLNKKEVRSFLKYIQMADKINRSMPGLSALEESKRRLNYLRQIQGNFFLKYKKMIWQKERD